MYHFRITKFVQARSIADALALEPETPPTEVYVDEEGFTQTFPESAGTIGFQADTKAKKKV